ncbi:MAG: ester cyclase [Streptosporangiaceae bacterium]
MTAADNRAVIERFDAILNSQDLSQLDKLCTPDMVNHALAPGRPTGLAGTREFLSNQGSSGWRSDRWWQVMVMAESDYVVQYGIREGHWPGGSFRGVQIPEGEYTREVAFMYRLYHGRIAERWAVRDDLGMMQQLGAMPTGS